MKQLTILQATGDDLPVILDIQKKAFLEVARVYHLKTLPPLEQTLENLRGEFENGTILKASFENTIVGSVRAHREIDTCHIGKLVVLPEYQNQGIGKALMHEIEVYYQDAVRRYELFTGSRDPRNRRLYDQLGYRPFKTEKINEELLFIYMQKNL